MDLITFIILLVIAAVAGAVAQAIVGYSVGGCVISAVIGLVGAYLGYWLAGVFHLPPILNITINGITFPFVWAILGAIILVLFISLFTGRGYGRRRL